jgi:S1-C subfamily serine protease
VTAVDWLIVAFTAVLAVYGYLQGFIVGALSLAGFAIGAFVGARLGPLLLPSGSHSPYAPLFGLLGALLAGGLIASGFEGLGVRARGVLRLPGLRAADGLLGAALTACIGLGIAWIVGAVAVQASGSARLRRDLQSSAILKELNQLLPPSGPILNALARFDPIPSMSGPSANVAAPPRGILAAAGVRAARASIVRVLGDACGLGIEGSGWVAAPDLVVTNAHVVAGETDTHVELGGQPPDLPAETIEFNPDDDIAVLRVPGLDAPALPLASRPRSGTPAAILGFPLDGPFDAEPGRIGQTRPVRTQDAYGQGDIVRSITSLRGRVRPGNSGGPMVSAAGRVVATVFAAVTGGGPPGGFAVPNARVRIELEKALAAGTGPAVNTGHCAG